VVQETEAILQKLRDADESFQASAELFFWREPFEVSTEEPIFFALQAACERRLGHTPAISGFSGWTDAALLQGAGIPTLLFGPTGAGLHGAIEYVETESLLDMAHILAETICDFCR
jgi:acetylornithine deacetylase